MNFEVERNARFQHLPFYSPIIADCQSEKSGFSQALQMLLLILDTTFDRPL